MVFNTAHIAVTNKARLHDIFSLYSLHSILPFEWIVDCLILKLHMEKLEYTGHSNILFELQINENATAHDLTINSLQEQKVPGFEYFANQYFVWDVKRGSLCYKC